MITDKTHKWEEDRRHASMLEIPERVYEECQVKLKKVTVKSHKTDSTDRGVPLRQYDPKLIRARSWFEGVRCPETSGIGV